MLHEIDSVHGSRRQIAESGICEAIVVSSAPQLAVCPGSTSIIDSRVSSSLSLDGFVLFRAVCSIAFPPLVRGCAVGGSAST